MNLETWQSGRSRYLGKVETRATGSVGSNPTVSSNHHMQIYILLKALMKVARTTELPMTPLLTNPIERRVVKLGVPRGSGKTTAIMELHKERPSVVITSRAGNALFLKATYPWADVKSLSDLEGPPKPHDKAISEIFVDEGLALDPVGAAAVFAWALQQAAFNTLTEDYLIVMTGT